MDPNKSIVPASNTEFFARDLPRPQSIRREELETPVSFCGSVDGTIYEVKGLKLSASGGLSEDGESERRATEKGL